MVTSMPQVPPVDGRFVSVGRLVSQEAVRVQNGVGVAMARMGREQGTMPLATGLAVVERLPRGQWVEIEQGVRGHRGQ